MSAPLALNTPLSSTGHGAARTSGRSTSRAGAVIILILVLAIAAGIANSALEGRDDKRDYSPSSLQPQGVGALAQLLTDHGVEVEHIQTSEALHTADAQSTVVIAHPKDLSDEEVQFVRKSGAAVIVLGTTSFFDGAIWGFGDGTWTSEEYHDGDDLASSALTASACTPDGLIDSDTDGSTISPVNQVLLYADTASHCFGTAHEGVSWAQSAEYPSVFYFGATRTLTNEFLDQYDNAGVAMRMLSQHPRLLWVEGYSEPGEEAEPSGGLPDWFSLACWAVLLSGVWYAAYRWRRFGKLVVEPLPVVVPAEEANLGRARLYQTNSDAGHAARVLRSAFIARHASRYGISPNAERNTVVQAFTAGIASHTDTSATVDTQSSHVTAADIDSALYSYPVHTDHDLAYVTSTLGILEKELTHGYSR